MIPISTLRTAAMSLGEAPFLARFPDPALVIATPGASSARGDPMAWLGKTVADEAAFERTIGVTDTALTPSPEVDLAAATARAAAFFARKAPGESTLFPDMITIGRVPNNDIVLAFPTVSKVHAYLRRDGEGWRLHDHRATNGTFVSQRRLAPGGSHPLEDGDVIHIGPSLTLTFLLPPSLFGFVRGTRREPGARG